MPDTLAGIPLWAIAIDYLLGIVMWTLIGRFAMGLFLLQDSDWFFMKAFRQCRRTSGIVGTL